MHRAGIQGQRKTEIDMRVLRAEIMRLIAAQCPLVAQSGHLVGLAEDRGREKLTANGRMDGVNG